MESPSNTTRPGPDDPQTSGRKPRWGDRLEVLLDGLDVKGEGVGDGQGHATGCRVHVRGAVPGSRVLVDVVKRRRDRVDAKLIEVLEASPDLVAPRCPHSVPCGGCSFQNLAYPAQLRALHARLTETFAGAGLLEHVIVEPVVGMEDPWHYRNKMDFTFGARRWRSPEEMLEVKSAAESAAESAVGQETAEPLDDSFALGLHVPGMWSKVLDVNTCSIAFEGADRILCTVRRLARAAGLEPWSVTDHTGLLRHLVLRRGMRTDQIMLVLVTSERAEERIDPFLRDVLDAHPELTTIVQDVTDRLSAVALGDEQHVHHGPGVIHEEIGGLTFEISPHSFFQTNTVQAERLFEIVREQALGGEIEQGPETVLYDLYCGAGTIGLFLRGAVGDVWGFETVPAAVADARKNAERNNASGSAVDSTTGGLGQIHFVEGDVLASLRDETTRPRPDIVVLDPPRAGLHPKVHPAVLDLAPQRIVYVSCNPTSAARDVPQFLAQGYRVERVQPVDLFPHTPHVETVITLHRSQ